MLLQALTPPPSPPPAPPIFPCISVLAAAAYFKSTPSAAGVSPSVAVSARDWAVAAATLGVVFAAVVVGGDALHAMIRLPSDVTAALARMAWRRLNTTKDAYVRC